MERLHCWESVIGPQERLVLGNYPAESRMGQRPALLLIDLYQRVFGDRRQPIEDAVKSYPASCGEAAWDALGSLTDLLSTARQLSMPVAHTTGEDRSESQLGGATRRRPDRGGASAAGYEFFEPVQPEPGEFVVRKTRASAFFGTPLASWLQLQGVDSLVVAGESTSGCVRATVVDAFSHGFMTMVCEEAVFDRSPLSHKVSLFDLHCKYATVAHVDDTLDYMRSTTS